MTRSARPQTRTGDASTGRKSSDRGGSLRLACAAALARLALGLVLVLLALPHPAAAQDPSALTSTKGPKSSFPAQKGGILGGPIKKIDKAQPLYLQADELDYDTRNNRVIARGSVEIYFNEYVLTADQVIYDQNSNSLTAQGNAQIKEPNGNIVRGEKIDTTADFRDAFIQSLSLIGKDDSRIAARRAVRKDGNITEFEQGKFTACKSDPGKPPLWCISAQRIIHDQQAASISYQDAQFEIFGVPILYVPYFTHPDPSVKRQTGFLAPQYKSSSTLGGGVVVPYYFALSPNYDFLFHPEYLTKHGVLYMGDWGQKVAVGGIKGQYTVKLAGIDQDANTLDGLDAASRAKLDGWRGSMQTQGLFSLSSWWRFGWDVTLESDETFRRFYRLDNILQTDRVNTAFLQGQSDRNYFAMTFYQFGGLLLDARPSTESWVLPVIDYNYVAGKPVLGGELAFNANAVNLTRNDGTDSQRVTMEANWRRRLIDGIGQTWTPFANARGDVTHFTNGFDPALGVSIPADTVARVTGAAGLTYAYPFVAHTAAASHVLEPTAQLVARQSHIEQARLPDEDAKSVVFDDTILFASNKFSGWDRIDTGTRVNIGLQYTYQAHNGAYARLVAGQSILLAGSNAFLDPGLVPYGLNNTLVTNFSPRTGLETDRSDYVVGAYLAPVNYFRFVAQSRFDETDLALRRTDVSAQTTLGPVNVTGMYSYTRDDPAIGLMHSPQEVLGQATLKLTDRWSIGGTLRYDLDNAFLLQDAIQLKYADECFVLTMSYIESQIQNTSLDIKPDRTLMLRFELKYLGDFAYKSSGIDHIFAENQPPK